MDARLRSAIRTTVFSLIPVLIVILASPELSKYLHIDSSLGVIITLVIGAIARAFARPGELPEEQPSE